MSTEGGTKVSTVVAILVCAGLLIAAGAVTVWRINRAREEQEHAAVIQEKRILIEERERLMRAEVEQVRRDAEKARAALDALHERIAPMPRERPALNPVELAEAKRIAHRHCQNLAQAAEAFNLNAANAGGYPRTLKELVMPPFGGPSFLKNGERDLIDPWGKPYQLEPFQRADGTSVPLVLCFGPDNVPISQFGIGDKARPLK